MNSDKPASKLLTRRAELLESLEYWQAQLDRAVQNEAREFFTEARAFLNGDSPAKPVADPALKERIAHCEKSIWIARDLLSRINEDIVTQFGDEGHELLFRHFVNLNSETKIDSLWYEGPGPFRVPRPMPLQYAPTAAELPTPGQLPKDEEVTLRRFRIYGKDYIMGHSRVLNVLFVRESK